MTPTPEQPSTVPYVDERGVVITPEGRRQARQMLDELDARWNAEERAKAHAAFLARLDNA
jgi:hypothetical protein